MTKIIPAGKFKATCLKLMDHVKQHRDTFIVTKNGIPFIKVIPADDEVKTENVLGCMKNTIEIIGDILKPVTTPTNWKINHS